MNKPSQNFETTQQNIIENEELECTSLHILHDAQEGSLVETYQLLIDGTTDKYSSQFSHTANIKTHKGTLRCHEAKINTLDGGEVHATHVHIYNCLSGTIYAQDVTIENVGESLTVFASNSIKVNLVKGSLNTFTIDYKSVPILNSRLELIEHDIHQLFDELEDAKKHNHSIVSKLNEQIELLEKDKTSILKSFKIAKVTLGGTVYENNKVVFVTDETTLEYVTKKQSYAPFCISTQKSTIIFCPTTAKALHKEN